jgi:DNA-binding phage protein
MFDHDTLWHAIEEVARTRHWSISHLATRAGLDPTALSASKRLGPDGKPRWPSTHTISRILRATQLTLVDFAALVDSPGGPRSQACGFTGMVARQRLVAKDRYSTPGAIERRVEETRAVGTADPELAAWLHDIAVVAAGLCAISRELETQAREVSEIAEKLASPGAMEKIMKIEAALAQHEAAVRDELGDNESQARHLGKSARG